MMPPWLPSNGDLAAVFIEAEAVAERAGESRPSGRAHGLRLAQSKIELGWLWAELPTAELPHARYTTPVEQYGPDDIIDTGWDSIDTRDEDEDSD